MNKLFCKLVYKIISMQNTEKFTNELSEEKNNVKFRTAVSLDINGNLSTRF